MRSENQDAIYREFGGVLMYELYLVQLSTLQLPQDRTISHGFEGCPATIPSTMSS